MSSWPLTLILSPPAGRGRAELVSCLPLSGRFPSPLLNIGRGCRVRVWCFTAKFRVNHIQHSIQILLNLHIPESQHSDSPPRQICVTRHIVTFPPIYTMYIAIKLHGQFLRCAIKIQYVWPERMLPTKLEPGKRSIAKTAPNLALCPSRSLPQTLGQFTACAHTQPLTLILSPPAGRGERNWFPVSLFPVGSPLPCST